MKNYTDKISNSISLLDKIFLFSNIPFTIITVFIITFYIQKLNSVIRVRNIPNNMQKHQKIRILVLTFVNVILQLELLSNISAALSGLVYGFLPIYNQNAISHTNSCQVNVAVDFQMQLFPKGWFAYLPAMLSISLIQFLQPTVSLLLNVLRRAYLDYPYRTIIKRWMCIILIRGCILFLLLSYYQTVYIGISILPIIFIVDFSFYIKHSREFHSLLRSRMEVARVQSSRREYRDKSIVLFQYRITSSYTILTFSILTLKYCTYGIRFFIHGSIRLLCLNNFVTFGYSPLIFFNSNILDILNNVYFYLFVIFHCLDFLYQILVSFAYCIVCIGIAINFYRKTKKYKHINRSIQPLISFYHKNLN